MRAAYRNANEPDDRNDNLGFRCARAHERVGESAPEQADLRGVACTGACSPKHDGGRRAGRGAGWPLERSPACRRGCADVTEVVDAGWHPLADGAPPDWASAWGQDRFGVWVAFTIAEVTQRMRWIPPGRFLMGSPAAEAGRWDDEGPQHEVTLAEGFWLFDTPCTQALWQAVMGSNPSQFQSPTRPVERVSLEDVRAFLERVNALVPGLDLALPSEARWEYACRAGTTTATWAGDLETGEERIAPVLDPISWYAGNADAGTHPVALKAANLSGLYDMLGNVWEWCADEWHDSYVGAPSDGSPWTDRDRGPAFRVVRGGSWYGEARYVRAASRNYGEPVVRYGILGFRCARVQVSGQRSGGRLGASAASGASTRRRPSRRGQAARSGRP